MRNRNRTPKPLKTVCACFCIILHLTRSIIFHWQTMYGLGRYTLDNRIISFLIVAERARWSLYNIFSKTDSRSIRRYKIYFFKFIGVWHAYIRNNSINFEQKTNRLVFGTGHYCIVRLYWKPNNTLRISMKYTFLKHSIGMKCFIYTSASSDG